MRDMYLNNLPASCDNLVQLNILLGELTKQLSQASFLLPGQAG